MTNRFRISSSVFSRLEDVGVSPAKVLQHAGIPTALLSEEKILVTTEELFGVYRSIAALSDDPAIGLKLGSEERMERYDPIAIAALCTRSFRDALQRLARYKQLTCPEELKITETADDCTVRFVWLLAREDEPTQLTDLCFAWVVAIARRGTGRTLNPRRIEFARSAANRETYEAHFQCPIKFDAPHNIVVFHAKDLDMRFLTHNADLLAMVAPQLEAELNQQHASQKIAGQVKAVLKRMFAGQRPGLQDVARELRLSGRTLQRRLTEESLTFQQLVKEARRELAQHYLLHSSLELNETAYLLGYEDANSFFRAFQDWEGTSPGEWRASRTVTA
jgi:AraC-like DNA-binding protein